MKKIMLIAALLAIAGCAAPEEKKGPVKVEEGVVVTDPNYVHFQKPGTIPRDGTRGKYVILRYPMRESATGEDKYVITRYPEDKYLPINPYRDLKKVPMQRSAYNYREGMFIEDTRRQITDMSGATPTGRPPKTETEKKREEFKSAKKAEK